ncbi:MAG: hypothetical protein U0V74_14480 [Chitinophagales bacterium]
MIIVFRWVPYSAMAVWPFILIKKDEMRQDVSLKYHEKIHHRQQLELLIIPFYLLYLFNYLINLLKYRQHLKAYKEIVFEREAFANDKDLSYLKKRRAFAFLRYL